MKFLFRGKRMAETKEQLQAQIDSLKSEIAVCLDQVAVYMATINKLEDTVGAQRKTIDGLKEKLYNAHIDLAREAGYRERVESDDTAREDLVNIHYTTQTPNGPVNHDTFVPKRSVGEVSFSEVKVSNGDLNWTRDECCAYDIPQPPHWVNY